MSTRSVSKETTKTSGTGKQREELQTELEGVPEVVSTGSRSALEALSATAEFQLDWDNDVRFHVAENAIRLRKARGMSQAEVAEAMGTSQSAIARIEGEEENITLGTLARLVDALDGRLFISISPAERRVRFRNWWQLSGWDLVFGAYSSTGESEKLLLGFERDGAETTTPAELLTETARAS